MKLLIVEDDHNLSDTIKAALEGVLDAQQVYDGDEALYQAREGIYDIIILDIMLPGLNGYQVLEALRKDGVNTPVLVLTAKDGIDDKIQGFKSGADDYLVKPFHREELLLRVEAILRRANGAAENAHVLTFADLRLDARQRSVCIGGQRVELQGKQFDLLEYLMTNRNIILTKEQMFDRIWGFDSNTTANVVEVYASSLRKSLKPYGYDSYIKTVRGMGYMLSETGR